MSPLPTSRPVGYPNLRTTVKVYSHFNAAGPLILPLASVRTSATAQETATTTSLPLMPVGTSACWVRAASKAGWPIGHQRYTQQEYNISSVNRTLWPHNKDNLEDEVWNSNMDFNCTELEDLKGNQTRIDCCRDPDFTFTCDYLTVTQCQALMKDQAGDAQVMSFSPGVKCSDMKCGGCCGCFLQRKLWGYGERFRQSCEDCTCKCCGRVDCACRHLTRRKEIRDLTLREMRLYQRAIMKLYSKSGQTVNLNFVSYLFEIQSIPFVSLLWVYLCLCVCLYVDLAVWKGFALLRAEFSPLAGDHAFFLPWHCYFLRLVEQELQSISSCKLALSFFEWTVDSGSMKFSAAWQAGLFGGDGDPGSGCIPHHPFQGLTSRFHWSPCLRRSFNSSVCQTDFIPLTAQLTLILYYTLQDFELYYWCQVYLTDYH